MKRTDINLSVTILDIINVNEVESKFELKFRMKTAWNDERLTFISLNEDEENNLIDNSSDIWIPQIGFMDVINPVQDNLGESDEVMQIRIPKNEVGILTRSDDVEKNFLYRGKTIQITKKSRFVGSFLCSFNNIYKYPFDTEVCSIKMIIAGKNNAFTKLVASDLHYIGKPHSIYLFGNY